MNKEIHFSHIINLKHSCFWIALSSESDSEAEEAPSVAPSNPNEEDGPPQSRNKRAKSLPRFRDPSLPRNMASVNMKRAQSTTRLKESDDDSDSDDSDIRSLIESVYMPLVGGNNHLSLVWHLIPNLAIYFPLYSGYLFRVCYFSF